MSGSPFASVGLLDMTAVLAVVVALSFAAAAGPPPVDPCDLELRVNASVAPQPDRVEPEPPVRAMVAVDGRKVLGRLDPLFIGYNLEDLSHELHPGLCAQMLYHDNAASSPQSAQRPRRQRPMDFGV